MIVSGEKAIELRTWNTSVRGDIVVHAGMKGHETGEDLPYGALVGVVDLWTVTEVTTDDLLYTVSAGSAVPVANLIDMIMSNRGKLYAWWLRDPRKLGPIAPFRGFPGFFKVDAGLIHG